MSLNRTKKALPNSSDFKLDPETFKQMTGKNWKKKIHLQVDAAENEFVDMTYKHEEYQETLRQQEIQSNVKNEQIAQEVRTDKNMEVAVSNILGQENIEHLIEILKTGEQTFSYHETSVGDTLIHDHKKKILKTADLTQSYMRQLVESIPNLNHKMKEAHMMIQRMIQRSVTMATENMANFMTGCYEYHNEVIFHHF